MIMRVELKFLASVLIASVMVSDGALAQESNDADGAQQQQDDEFANGSADEQTDTERPDLDSQPLETPTGQTPGRFIPSEQISLDLGVSFPVDI